MEKRTKFAKAVKKIKDSYARMLYMWTHCDPSGEPHEKVSTGFLFWKKTYCIKCGRLDYNPPS